MARAGSNHKGGSTDGGFGEVITGAEMARILGMARNTVTRLAKAGMPVYDYKGPRKAPRFDSATCIRWLRDREIQKARGGDESDNLDIDEIRRRTELAKMKQAEIETAVVEERFGDVEAILEELSAALATIRASLVSMPKYAAQLEHQDALTIERRLEEEIFRILEELSDFTVEDDDGSSD